MKKILVLDRFTNGHSAALKFIKLKDWESPEYEILFCGSHREIFERLTTGEYYAVLPVKNSTKGEIEEVTREISRLESLGYNFEEQGRLVLEIKHHLLSKGSLEEIETILSHPQALNQCSEFIENHCYETSGCDSTGKAAKIVSREKSGKLAAIANEKAAEHYRLKILESDLANDSDNRTTFVLLQNKAEVERLTVGIIGIAGREGKMLEEFFKEIGCKVIGSDLKIPDGLTNQEVVRKADVVIFAILPISEVPRVIKQVIPFTRENQLLMDVTSVKKPAVLAMLESQAQVIGLHPMFRPEVSFSNQTVVACPHRLNKPFWKRWSVNMLSRTGAEIKWCKADEHDRYMMSVQVDPHLSHLVSALLLESLNLSAGESLEFTSPFYRIMLSLTGRLLSQNPSLYASLIVENPETVRMLKERIEIEKKILKLVEKKDTTALIGQFQRARKHFGENVVQDGNELFSRIFSVFSTLYGENTVILEFSKEYDGPGLLNKVTNVFGEADINLTGITSCPSPTDPRMTQFVINLGSSKESEKVKNVLEKIENLTTYPIRVL